MSCVSLESLAIPYPGHLPPPPPSRLMRSFNGDNRALPQFVQETLLEWYNKAPIEHIHRIESVLKHIQYHQKIDREQQGRLWFIINDILKKGLLYNKQFLSDGRQLRKMLWCTRKRDQWICEYPYEQRMEELGLATPKV
jgi:hypothetical protein